MEEEIHTCLKAYDSLLYQLHLLKNWFLLIWFEVFAYYSINSCMIWTLNGLLLWFLCLWGFFDTLLFHWESSFIPPPLKFIGCSKMLINFSRWAIECICWILFRIKLCSPETFIDLVKNAICVILCFHLTKIFVDYSNLYAPFI